MLLLEIRSLSLDRIELDEAVAALAISKLIVSEYTVLDAAPPDWLGEKIVSLQKEIKSRHRDFLERALRQAKSRAETFKSRDQKAADTAREIETLTAALNKTQ